ncbi:MAG: SpoVG family protein [bacterium]
MDVTSVRIYPVEADKDRLIAFASVVFDEEFVVHNMRLVQADSRVIVAMPNEYSRGDFRDIAHPITNQCREQIRRNVIKKYNDKVDEGEQVELEARSKQPEES